MLHTEIKKVEQYLPKINWANDGNEGRYISKQKIEEVQNDYLNAWYVKQIAYRTNTQKVIEDYYTKNARKNIFNIIKYNKEKKTTINANSYISALVPIPVSKLIASRPNSNPIFKHRPEH